MTSSDSPAGFTTPEFATSAAAPAWPAAGDPAELAVTAAGLVKAAGVMAKDMRERGVRSEEKTSVSDIVTDADRAAEALVLRRLKASRETDGVLGEEGTSEAGSSGITWVIDPVDGTYNFFTGSSYWCSALAVTAADGPEAAARYRAPLLGAVYRPRTAEAWVGGPGRPTTRNGQEVGELEDRPLAESCISTYLHPTSFGTETDAAWERVLSGGATYRVNGSASVDLAEIASGRGHVWVQHSLPAWDRLPGAGLILGAGGEVATVTAGGVTWMVAGNLRGVREAVDLLLG